MRKASAGTIRRDVERRRDRYFIVTVDVADMQADVAKVLSLCFDAFHDLKPAFGISETMIEILLGDRNVLISSSKCFEEAEDLQTVLDALLRIDESNLSTICLVSV